MYLVLSFQMHLQLCSDCGGSIIFSSGIWGTILTSICEIWRYEEGIKEVKYGIFSINLHDTVHLWVCLFVCLFFLSMAPPKSYVALL